MRKITQQAVRAFERSENFTGSNTKVRVMENVETGMLTTKLYLHDNCIAKKTSGGVRISNAGRSSVTTKERLNGLAGVSIQQKNWTRYLNGQEWDGSRIKID